MFCRRVTGNDRPRVKFEVIKTWKPVSAMYFLSSTFISLGAMGFSSSFLSLYNDSLLIHLPNGTVACSSARWGQEDLQSQHEQRPQCHRLNGSRPGSSGTSLRVFTFLLGKLLWKSMENYRFFPLSGFCWENFLENFLENYRFFPPEVWGFN